MLEKDIGSEELESYWEPYKMFEKYRNNAQNYHEYRPDYWRNITDEEKELGHGGMDYLMMKTFLHAAMNGEEMPIDVYDAAAWMCITALTEQSIACGGMPQQIPDFTRGKWVTRTRKDVVKF